MKLSATVWPDGGPRRRRGRPGSLAFVAGTGAVLLLAGLIVVPGTAASAATATVYEAEDGVLNGVTVADTAAGYSGTGYVAGFDTATDSVSITIPDSPGGLYDLSVRYRGPYGSKVASLKLNGAGLGDLSLPETTDFTDLPAGKVLLRPGDNTVTVVNNWGWYEIDAIGVAPSADRPAHQVTEELVNPDASAEARSLMRYLRDNYGKHILSGQQDASSIKWVEDTIGKSPAIGGYDLIDYSPSRVARGTASREVENMLEWDARGGIVTLAWHWNAPSGLIDTPGKEWWRGFYTEGTTFDVAAALADKTSPEYALLIRDIDAIAVQLQRLEDADIPVLWRPLHEAEGGWFWWGAKGPGPTKELWRIMYDRLTTHHSLDNLIWVWNSKAASWYPGDDVVDVVSIDSYPPQGDHGALSGAYDELVTLGSDRKLVALGEVGGIPDPDLLRAYQAHWSWFVTWTGTFINDGVTNPRAFLTRLYADPYVLTRDELGDFKHYTGTPTSTTPPVTTTPVTTTPSTTTTRPTTTTPSTTSTGVPGSGFSIRNGRLFESNGQEFVIRGVNHAHTWYSSQTSSFAAIKAAGANSVRVVLSGGRWSANTAADVANVISLCKANKLICVLENHDTTGFQEQAGATSLDAAANYWVSLAAVLKGQEKYVIINIGNEPWGNTGHAGWTAATQGAIKKLRAAGFTHTIMVDAPNWGQDWSFTMRDNAPAVFAADPLANTIFSVHMYGVFDTAAEVRAYLDSFTSRGLPILVGEFGDMHSDGNPDENTIMSYTRSQGLGMMGWSWSGNGGGVEYLDMTTNFNPAALTPWGQRFINGADGLKLGGTKEASVFSGVVTTTTTTSTTPPVTTTSTTPPVTTTSTTPPVTTTSTTPPVTTSTTPPVTTTTTSTGSGKSCSATYAVVGQWPGGFQGDVKVTAGSSAITGWRLTWTFANGQTVTQSWSSTLTSGGSTVSASDAHWNGALGAGASTRFGFIGSWNGSNSVPTVTCAAE